ncbi:hypothetical protein DFP72DRAFT_30969 [Ephemerocybe angulata]|uniref:Secreted protein n=1 Tax=Ephemerocybe angulata TaxID=980116 RepID=A0A8H6IAY9_9AGAR|nr:hypothetical protein DFP72DRAFT_30969 [Tulosesus angulatus]
MPFRRFDCVLLHTILLSLSYVPSRLAYSSRLLPACLSVCFHSSSSRPPFIHHMTRHILLSHLASNRTSTIHDARFHFPLFYCVHSHTVATTDWPSRPNGYRNAVECTLLPPLL